METGCDPLTPPHFWGPWFGNGEPPCDWLRAFEAYGHAMATATCLEELMLLSLMHAEVFRLGKRKGAKTTLGYISRMLESWQRERFNGLMNRCWKTFDLSKELRDAMQIAKEGRDHLAHQFWRGHGSNLWTNEGIEIIATDCALSAHHFRNVSDALIVETGINYNSYIEMKKSIGLSGTHVAGWNAIFFGELNTDASNLTEAAK
jgi:hypothetical protein